MHVYFVINNSGENKCMKYLLVCVESAGQVNEAKRTGAFYRRDL